MRRSSPGATTAEADIMVVDFDGNAVGSDHRPSAETLLHTQLYRRFPEVGCILHTHSRNQTVASRLFAGAGRVRLEGYELLKAFRGNETHETTIDVPVLPNNQHMPTLAAQVDALLDAGPMWGYLIDGHGLYAWGRDMAEARRTGRLRVPVRLRAGHPPAHRRPLKLRCSRGTPAFRCRNAPAAVCC